MDVRPALLEVVDERMSMRLNLKFAHGHVRMAQEHGGDEWHRQYRNGYGDGAEQLTAKPLYGFKTIF